jgi:L-seryl-tRNA(Ser) seleniumtransferase
MSTQKQIQVSNRLRAALRSIVSNRSAENLHLEPGDVSRYMDGEIPDPVTLSGIANAAGTTPQSLLHGKSGSKESKGATEPAKHGRGKPPPVNRVVNHPMLADILGQIGRPLVTQSVREVVKEWIPQGSVEELVEVVAERALAKARQHLIEPRDFVNASGIIIHTGWGNAPLHSKAVDRLAEATRVTPTGGIGGPKRTELCASMLCALTGAEAATVTTLNAAALMLVAAAGAAGREVIVAARDLVEISDGSRLNEIMDAVGARVVAVGSANCVNINDYRRAIGPETAMIMRVHASNVLMTGYVEHVDDTTLGELARESGLHYAINLGGGSLVDLTAKGLPSCPMLKDAIDTGADYVLASSDKIIGGPQAGIIVGKNDALKLALAHPLARVCRPGKLTLSALEATLAVYMSGSAWDEIPTLRLINADLTSIRRRAEKLADSLQALGYQAQVVEDKSECGGAVLPGVELPTWTVRVGHPDMRDEDLSYIISARRVLTRIAQGNVVLDLRSVPARDDGQLYAAFSAS